MNVSSTLIVAQAFLAARWRAARLRDRDSLMRCQETRLRHLTRHACRSMAFYRPYATRRFEDFPVVAKDVMLENFVAMNCAGIDLDTLRNTLAEGKERIGRHIIGQSTGTSGNRGYYVISEAERFVWLGTILAKTLPDALWRRHRLALAMPGLSSLYRSATSGSRIELGFFDLSRGVESWADELTAFAPDTIVAPPKVLRWLAEHDRLRCEHIFSGAEVLDPLDRAVIEGATGRRVREIYMATEGLFGVACALGTLHLAEDVVHFEWERPDPASVLVSPIVTDFTRRTQAMIRYRMNDLLELDAAPCPCGSPYQAVKRIQGRRDDIFLLDGRMVTPDILRNAVVDSHPAIADFRIVQTGPNAITVALAEDLPRHVDDRVRAMLLDRLSPLAASPEITITRGLPVPLDAKLRRVRCDWRRQSG